MARHRRKRKSKPGGLSCPGCSVPRQPRQVVCRDCWFAMPVHVRADLFRAWRLAYSHLSDDAMWHAYLGSRRVALHWLRSRSA